MNTARCTLWNHLKIETGTQADYAALKEFHYRSGHPGGIKRVFVARYAGPGLGGSDATDGMLAGVLVESLPALGCALRSIALPGVFQTGDRSLDAAKLNRDMRTISRVIVHPMFRSVGLAVELVRYALVHAETPYVEALAAMGRVNPFFERAGMRAFDRPALGDVVRMVAALEREGLRAIDLADPGRVTRTPFLEAELRRFCRKSQTWEEMIAEARGRLLSQPVYYVWASTN
ncbi:MAG TPA: hypothetical protein VM008_09675 [Phycisphaerae bacterium]|nr:hypothetical protein [Phycisphaerae bacterium]